MKTPRKRVTFPTPIRKPKPNVKKNDIKQIKKQEVHNKIKQSKKPDIKKNKSHKNGNLLQDMDQLPQYTNLPSPPISDEHGKNLVEYLANITETRQKEIELLLKLQKENRKLKDLNRNSLDIKSNSLFDESVLFSKFLGLEISEKKENSYEFKWAIIDGGVQKMIMFELDEDTDDYTYDLLSSENLNIPEVFQRAITFEKKMLFRFFFNIYEMFLARNE